MRILCLVLALAAVPATAQDRAGNDTPGEWRVTHHAHFGLWDSVCDERDSLNGAAPEQRCYVRYVDVFSPNPKFAAQFVFVTPEGAGHRVEFGTEAGTRFVQDGLRIERVGAKIWATDRPGCLTGGTCVFVGADANALVDALQTGDSWRFHFADRHGAVQDLTWDLAPVAAALADFDTEAKARNLR